jgi:ribonucleoside-diphosphate reductase alpha subunit
MSYFVEKRSGKQEQIHFDKITSRIERLCYNLDRNHVDPISITMKVIGGIYSGIKTRELDNLAADICSTMTHPDYALLAARIFVSNLHKETKKNFSDVVKELYKDPSIINERLYNDVMFNQEAINSMIVYDRDYSMTYFGLKTLEKAYLLRKENVVIERPQHLFMRVSVAIHGRDLDAILETYESMSNKYFIHATPTLFNAGTLREGLSSCFVISATKEDDSVENIYELLKETAIISKYSGGIGISISDIRAKGSRISSTNGKSGGIIPMLGMYNKSSRYVTQGKRPGSIAVYLEPWHAEIEEFLQLKEANGIDELRARDLFYGLWIPDLFMKRVIAEESWSLMCPNECPGLSEVYGEEFEELYTRYESEKRYRRQVPAQELFHSIMVSQIRTGGPYMCYKDHANNRNNQSHVDTIKLSNLCSEIMLPTSHEETAVCNLASIGLPSYVDENNEFDYELLYKKVKIVVRNLDKVVDLTHYPVEKARKSNMRHRPLGLGVSGLASLFSKMRISFDSAAAKELNCEIFETIHYAALEASCELAQEKGAYESYNGSEISKGKLQWDLWKEQGYNVSLSGRWDWDKLRKSIVMYGVRNSHLLALMPTASTGILLGNTECIEPLNSNLYKRTTLSGEFQLVNPQLVRDLCAKGLWNDTIKDLIIIKKGSVQGINEIPKEIQQLYKISWDLPQKLIVDLAADRAPFICQSQSLNIFFDSPDFDKLSKMHIYGWKKGLKTGMYYLRSRSAASALQFSVSKKEEKEEVLVCTRDDPSCMSCSA